MAEVFTKSISDYLPMRLLQLIDNQFVANTVVQIWFNLGRTFPKFSKFRKCNNLRSGNPQYHLLGICSHDFAAIKTAL